VRIQTNYACRTPAGQALAGAILYAERRVSQAAANLPHVNPSQIEMPANQGVPHQLAASWKLIRCQSFVITRVCAWECCP
jgi:hypothetical protein